MRKVRISAIGDFKYVFADGKWLALVGNKPVKVGDRVWTDGRCVYGNFQDAQSPIVITPDEDWIIPIAVRDGKGFSFANGQLEYIENVGKRIINNSKQVYAIPNNILSCNIDDVGNIYFKSA